MSAAATRVLVRAIHVLLGALVAMIVYLPTAWSDPIRLAVGLVVVPAVVLTGIVLWQQGRIRRLLGRRRARRRALR